MNEKIGGGKLKPYEVEFQKKQPFLRAEFNGHLWNDWAGIGTELKYLIDPAERLGYSNVEEEKIIRGLQLGAVLHKINLRPWIPIINIEKLPNDQRDNAARYNELVGKAMSLYSQIIEDAKKLSINQEKSSKDPCYIIPDGHHILILVAELKKVMIEANELLYCKKCVYFEN